MFHFLTRAGGFIKGKLFQELANLTLNFRLPTTAQKEKEGLSIHVSPL